MLASEIATLVSSVLVVDPRVVSDSGRSVGILGSGGTR